MIETQPRWNYWRTMAVLVAILLVLVALILIVDERASRWVSVWESSRQATRQAHFAPGTARRAR